jgi:hypothetical protein
LVAGEPTKAAAVLGFVVAPGLAHDVTSRVADELVEDLRERHGAIDWRTELLVDPLVVPPAPTTEILDAARRRLLLDSDWDLGVVVTDLPLRIGRRPVSRHVSPTHGVAVVSLPALGAINLRPPAAAHAARARGRAGRGPAQRRRGTAGDRVRQPRPACGPLRGNGVLTPLLAMPPRRQVLDQAFVPVAVKLSALWASTMFMFMFAYVDIFNFYKPGVVRDILRGKCGSSTSRRCGRSVRSR